MSPKVQQVIRSYFTHNVNLQESANRYNLTMREVREANEAIGRYGLTRAS